MKKLLFSLAIVALLSAGCNSSQPTAVQTQNTQQTQIAPTQQPTPTAITIKTYNDTAYGISFQYPPDWEVAKSGDEITVMNPNKPLMMEGSTVSPIVITVKKDTYQSKIENYITSPMLKTLLQQKQTVNIGGVSGFHIQGTTPPVSQNFVVVFYKGNVYDIANNAGTDEPTAQVFDQILNTFKFN